MNPTRKKNMLLHLLGANELLNMGGYLKNSFSVANGEIPGANLAATRSPCRKMAGQPNPRPLFFLYPLELTLLARAVQLYREMTV